MEDRAGFVDCPRHRNGSTSDRVSNGRIASYLFHLSLHRTTMSVFPPVQRPVISFGGTRNDTTGDCRREYLPSGHAAKEIRTTTPRHSHPAQDDAGAVR